MLTIQMHVCMSPSKREHAFFSSIHKTFVNIVSRMGKQINRRLDQLKAHKIKKIITDEKEALQTNAYGRIV